MIERFELFTTSIIKLYKSLQKIKNMEMTDLMLKGSHAMYLFELNRHREGLTVTELSSLCGEDKAATSRMINELINRGLVKSDSEKKYRTPLVLTKEGEQVAQKVDEMVINAVHAGSANMTDEERIHFYETLTTISNNLKEYIDKLSESI